MRKGKVPVRTEGSQRQSGKGDGQRERERRLLKEDLGPVDSEARSANARGGVSVSGSCVGIMFEYTLMTDTEAQNARKVPKTSPFLR